MSIEQLLFDKAPEAAIVIAGVGVGVRMALQAVESVMRIKQTTQQPAQAQSQPQVCVHHTGFYADIAIIKEREENNHSLLNNINDKLENYSEQLFDRLRKLETRVAVIEKVRGVKVTDDTDIIDRKVG